MTHSHAAAVSGPLCTNCCPHEHVIRWKTMITILLYAEINRVNLNFTLIMKDFCNNENTSKSLNHR